jgi:hypothetical protein
MAAPDPPVPGPVEGRGSAYRSAFAAIERVTLARHLAAVLEQLQSARPGEHRGDPLSPRRPVRSKE